MTKKEGFTTISVSTDTRKKIADLAKENRMTQDVFLQEICLYFKKNHLQLGKKNTTLDNRIFQYLSKQNTEIFNPLQDKIFELNSNFEKISKQIANEQLKILLENSNQSNEKIISELLKIIATQEKIILKLDEKKSKFF